MCICFEWTATGECIATTTITYNKHMHPPFSLSFKSISFFFNDNLHVCTYILVWKSVGIYKPMNKDIHIHYPTRMITAGVREREREGGGGGGGLGQCLYT